MRRYARLIEPAGIGSKSIELYVVIRTDDTSEPHVLAKGFECTDAALSDDQPTYGVDVIYEIRDKRLQFGSVN